jgi:hypothetical protein
MPDNLVSSSSLIIIALVCITVGYVFGWIVSSNTRKNKAPIPEIEPEKPVLEEKPLEAIPDHVMEAPPDKGLSPVLRVWTTGQASNLVVDFGEKTVNDPAQLTLDDRKQIESGLRATADWMGLAYQLGTPAPAATPLPPIRTAAVDPDIVFSEPMDLTRQPAMIAGMTNALADVLQPTSKKEASLSIVQQIDEIFQGMLVGTRYENNKIFLTEDLKRGVIVRVDHERYEGVGAVPEGEIKQLLRAAVAEWERQQEKNRRRQSA